MITWHYRAGQLRKLAIKAAGAWNKALGQTAFTEVSDRFAADVQLDIGPVDRSKDASRVAQFKGIKGKGVITLADDIQWSITPWQRFWGLGKEDAFAALLHEFGHSLGLPHSDRTSDVMHHELGTTVISNDEADRYRKFLKL